MNATPPVKLSPAMERMMAAVRADPNQPAKTYASALWQTALCGTATGIPPSYVRWSVRTLVALETLGMVRREHHADRSATWTATQ